MQVRCPTCNHSIDVAEDASLSSISCETCDSVFSLTGDERTTAYEAPEQQSIGHFALKRVIGRGAFGTVWQADDTQLERSVAIKMPRKGELEPAEAEQFLREARAAAQLHHPHIVSVHEVGRADERVYIVSDYVEGLTLADYLTAQRFDSKAAVELCAKIADGLDHAHEAGVIHRDLKPGNIMIDAKMQPHVMDFGLAKRETADATMTAEGKVVGTPAYMSPEQAVGVSKDLDRRTDIYSLGVIFYELLTGERPFRGNNRILLHQVINDEPPSPRKHNGRISRDLETICLKCMEKEPAKRYPTARAVHEEFLRYLRDEPIHARPISTTERFLRWCRRNPTVAGLSTLVALLLVAGSIVAAIAAFRFRSLANQARQDATNAERARKKEANARAAESETRLALEKALTDTYTSFGLLAAETNDDGQAGLWFAHAAAQAHNDPNRAQFNRIRFRNWTRQLSIPLKVLNHERRRIADLQFHSTDRYLLTRTFYDGHFLWDLTSGEPLAVGEKQRIDSAAWSPDGKFLAIAARDASEIQVLEFPSLKLAYSIPHTEKVLTLAFDAAGEQLAIASGGIRVWRHLEREFALAELPISANAVHLRFHENGNWLAAVCDDKTAHLFEVGEGQKGRRHGPFAHVTEEGFEGATPPVFLGKVNGLLTRTGADKVTCWDLDSGHETYVMRDVGRVTRIVPSPDATEFLVCQSLGVQRYDAASGYAIGKLMPHDNFVYSAIYSPDGNWLATCSADRTAKIWSTETGSQVGPDLAHQSEVLRVAFASDGRSLATAQDDGIVRIWTIPSRQAHRTRLELDNEQSFVALSPSGRYMIPSGWDAERKMRSVRVYDTATALPLGPKMETPGFFHGAAFSPDGNRVAVLSSSPKAEVQRPIPADLTSLPGSVSIRLWQSGESLFPPLQTPTEPMGCAYSSDGKSLAVICAAGEILLIDAATGKQRMQLEHGATVSPRYVVNQRLRFSPDNQSLISWGLGNQIRVWDAASGELRYTLDHTGSYMAYEVSFSADQKWLATCAMAGDHTTAVWNFETGELEASIDHPDWVFNARFAPGKNDESLLLTACRDGMARLWNWRENKLTCPAFVHSDDVFDGVFLGKEIVMTSSRDGTARIWETLTGKPLTPSFPLPGRAYQVLVTNDLKNAVVTGSKGTLHTFELPKFLSPARLDTKSESICALSELISGQRVYEGGVVNLTSPEWLNRWNSFNASHPDFLTDFLRSQ